MTRDEASDAVAREIHALGSSIDKLNEWMNDPAMREHLRREQSFIWMAYLRLDGLIETCKREWPLRAAE